MCSMDIGALKHLHDLLQGKLEKIDKNKAVKSIGSAIRSQIRLASTIRNWAGGSLSDINDNFGLSVCKSYPLTL